MKAYLQINLMLLLACAVAGCNTTGTPRPTAKERALNKKLDAIILPTVDFDNAPTPDVVNFLVGQSVLLDPKHEGITISFPYPNDDRQGTVTIHRQNISLRKALTLLCRENFTMGYHVSPEGAVLISNCHLRLEPIVTKAFPFPSSILRRMMEIFTHTAEPTEAALKEWVTNDFFRNHGDFFTYDTKSEIMTVTCSENDMVLMENMLKAWKDHPDAMLKHADAVLRSNITATNQPAAVP